MALIKPAMPPRFPETQIRNTHASGDAGAVYVREYANFEHVLIAGCSAGGNGGAVVADSAGNLQLVATTIERFGCCILFFFFFSSTTNPP